MSSSTRLVKGVLVLLLTSCCAASREEQLASVAKDWALVIRASQVLPVYPLTEDLQPGDVFLVTTPLGQEASLYSSRGFLPLDQHLVRLQSLDFQTFYQRSYNVGTNSNTPYHWQF